MGAFTHQRVSTVDGAINSWCGWITRTGVSSPVLAQFCHIESPFCLLRSHFSQLDYKICALPYLSGVRHVTKDENIDLGI